MACGRWQGMSGEVYVQFQLAVFVNEQGERRFSVGEPEEKPQIPPLRYPGFPVEVGGVGELHAAFPNESRTHGSW